MHKQFDGFCYLMRTTFDANTMHKSEKSMLEKILLGVFVPLRIVIIIFA